jgi:hypothetical protein
MLDLEQKAEHPRGLLRQGTKEYSLIKGVEEPVDHRVRQTLTGSRPINNTGMQNIYMCKRIYTLTAGTYLYVNEMQIVNVCMHILYTCM